MPTDQLDSFGRKITEPCEGQVSGKRCMWPFTFMFHGRWLCRECVRIAQQDIIVSKAKKFRKRQSRG